MTGIEGTWAPRDPRGRLQLAAAFKILAVLAATTAESAILSDGLCWRVFKLAHPDWSAPLTFYEGYWWDMDYVSPFLVAIVASAPWTSYQLGVLIRHGRAWPVILGSFIAGAALGLFVLH